MSNQHLPGHGESHSGPQSVPDARQQPGAQQPTFNGGQYPPPPSAQQPAFNGGQYPPPPSAQQPAFNGGQFPPPEPGAGSKKPFWKKKRFLIPAGIVAFFIAVSSANGGNKSDEVAAPAATSVAATPTAATSPAPAAAEPAPAAPAAPAPAAVAKPAAKFGTQPGDQIAFLAAFSAGKAAHEAAGNELQRAKAIADRDAAMCAAFGGGAVNEWAGTITQIGANGDGHATVEVRVSDNVLLKTWNNAFSDIGDKTLIAPPSALYDALLTLNEGQTVVFSGEFVPGDASCLKGTNLTDAFYAVDPDLLFRFSSVRLQ